MAACASFPLYLRAPLQLMDVGIIPHGLGALSLRCVRPAGRRVAPGQPSRCVPRPGQKSVVSGSEQAPSGGMTSRMKRQGKVVTEAGPADPAPRPRASAREASIACSISSPRTALGMIVSDGLTRSPRFRRPCSTEHNSRPRFDLRFPNALLPAPDHRPNHRVTCASASSRAGRGT